MDLDPYAEQETKDLGASSLFDLSRALVRMKVLQDRCVTEEGEALRTLNKEVTELNEKLEEETRQREKEQGAKATLEKELTILFGQVEMAKVDVIMEFKASQPFIDACAVYYGDWFEDCLKQAKSVYPHLDLSKVTMDDPLLSTPTGDTIFEETNDPT
ncbi:hypothetical protein SO802_010522 [Lithocarpus litseifolius]|uniref:Uncharacterized protein n=1 Tax=Lithocarpus litseifolius TaxID=425828 RepID=A0AAW2DIA2_9ROSI